MTKETAERAADLVRYLDEVEEELTFWGTAYSIHHVVVNSSIGLRTIEGQFPFIEVKELRVSVLNKLKKEWSDELEKL